MKKTFLFIAFAAFILFMVAGNKSFAQPTISGTNPMCIVPVTETLTISTGGTSGEGWQSVSTGVATVAFTSGTGVCTVSTVSAGTTKIIYLISGNPVCSMILTVDPTPLSPSITSGPTDLCFGGSTGTFLGTPSGGTWSSSAPLIASITPGGGVVTTAHPGATQITYTVSNACGPFTSSPQTLNVHHLPNAGVFPADNICVGDSYTFTSSGDPGGTWSSSSPSIGTVGATTGNVGGISPGTTDITYTVSNVCGPSSSTTTMTINVPVTSAPISGFTSECAGQTGAMTDAYGGGGWSSSNTAVATVDIFGNVTGVSAGTATISYSVFVVCGLVTPTPTHSITINATANPGVITTGTSFGMCTSSTISVTATGGDPAGTWGSSNPSIASVSGTGVGPVTVTSGTSAGTATISYYFGGGCPAAATQVVTVSASGGSAGTITPGQAVCAGGTTLFVAITGAIPGGSWSCTTVPTGAATINATTGELTGLLPGVATVTYTATGACGGPVFTSQSVSVDNSPTAGTITGGTAFCAMSSFALTAGSGATSGGSWTISSPIATLSSSALYTSSWTAGASAGSATVSYSVTNSCGTGAITSALAVEVAPVSTISPASVTHECVGDNYNLYGITGDLGGTWSSSNTAIGTVDASTGYIGGISGGTFTLSYTVTNSCGTTHGTGPVTIDVVVTPSVTAPGGTYQPNPPWFEICQSSTTFVLTGAPTGGTWTSMYPAIGTINATSGLVSPQPGSDDQTAFYTYTVSNACGSYSTNQGVTFENHAPNVHISGTSPILVYRGTTISLSATPTSYYTTGPVHCTWSYDGLATGLTLDGLAPGGFSTTTVPYTTWANVTGRSPSTGTYRLPPSPAPFPGTSWFFTIDYTYTNLCGTFPTASPAQMQVKDY